MAAVFLLGASGFLLPISALIVEAITEQENWIAVLYFVLAFGLGAAVGATWTAVAPVATSARRRAVIWGAVGLVAALAAAGVWLLLLAG